jgi:predicted CXXCH cytochrome family protein
VNKFKVKLLLLILIFCLVVSSLTVPHEQYNDDECMNCHNEIIDGKYVHGPVAVENCKVCHTDGSSPNKDDLIKICLDCHTDFLPGDISTTHFHEPCFSIGCTECHNVHTSNSNALLKESEEQLCLKCHDDLFNKNGEYSHSVEGCRICHEPHFSKYDNLFIAEATNLCVDPCHDSYVRERSHPVGRGVNDPLKGNELTCTSSCHVFHSSAYKALTPTSNRELCRSCHSDKY